MVPLDHWIWWFTERLYSLPAPPRRKRSKPMEVICVGPPRSGTESLQQALLDLGYDYTYHGWDIVYDIPTPAPGWVRLARKKWYAEGRDHTFPALNVPTITREDFDELIGHCVAVTDAAASCFAAEMIAAYPEAKVILNVRRDMDAWHRSAVTTLVGVNKSWGFYIASWLNRECFWAWHVYERFLWPLLFRAPDGNMAKAIERNGKWVYRGKSRLQPRDATARDEVGARADLG